MNISINTARDTITVKLDRHYTARLDRGDESAAKYIREQVRAYAEEHELCEGETVAAEVIGDDGELTLLYTTDVTTWH